jgi:hypothetical protein
MVLSGEREHHLHQLRKLIESGRYVVRPERIADSLLPLILAGDAQDLAESCSLALRSRSHMVRTKTR